MEGDEQRIAELLRSRGERMTAPRRAVLRVLSETGEHLTAETIVAAVAAVDPNVHRASVYRALDALVSLGVLQHIHVPHGGTAYHLARDGHLHLHVQCRDCRRIVDLPDGLLDAVADDLRRRHGFTLDADHVALSGRCPACRG